MISPTLPCAKTIGLLWITCVLAFATVGCSSSKPSADDPHLAKQDTPEADVAAVKNPQEVQLDDKHSAKVTVSSTPPGSLVLVDLIPVRNEKEGLALTPCEFTVSKGRHSISVELPGGRRATQPVDIQDDRELEFDVSAAPGELDDPSVLNAPFFEAAVGRSIRLSSLNSADRELDPFVSPDGRNIYFTSDRGGVRGIYTAARQTPYHDFGEPKLITATSGADLPVSPSVSEDGLTLVYAVAEKSRLWQLIRKDVESPFESKEIVRTDEQQERAWRSAQLTSDALRLYWTEEVDDKMITRAAVRSAAGKLFGKTLAFELPGDHPHLSSDGLRQFVFDGSSLQRSRRGSVRQTFGPVEVVCEVQPDGYVASPRHRQFWVTDDEQWLFYCDDPRSSGDLFVVRLSEGPRWGRSIVGKTIADKAMVASNEPEEKPKPASQPTEVANPKTQPLPYTTYWSKLGKLLEGNKGEEAAAFVKQSLNQQNLQNDRELLGWDQQLADGLVEFDRDVHRSLQSMKPGTVVRVGGTRFDFDRTDGDILHLKLKEKEVTKKLDDLSPGERISLAESGLQKAEGARAWRFGVYLYFQGKIHHQVADGWFKRAGSDGEQFYEQLAARTLHQGKAELERGNTGTAIVFLDAVSTVGPNTSAAKEAARQRETLYDTLVWKSVGPRKWKRDLFGEFIADASRSNGSYLTSERDYRDFEFSCEWKVTEPNSMGGVYLRYSGKGKPLENGAKIHLANDSDLKKMDRFATGSLFGVASPDENASHPAGTWNTLRIQVRDADVQVWINDKKVLTGTLGKDVPAEGVIMLDGVAGGISYRKVLLYDLPPTAGAQ